jgi:hypothetical protein
METLSVFDKTLSFSGKKVRSGLIEGPDSYPSKSALSFKLLVRTQARPHDLQSRPTSGTRISDPDRQVRGIVQLALSRQERIFDIAIISKIPVAFARVMFAPDILAPIQQLVEDFKEEIAQLRIIARNAAVSAELWLRSKQRTPRTRDTGTLNPRDPHLT